MQIVSAQRFPARRGGWRRTGPAVLCAASLLLSACGSTVSQLPGVGLPEGAPAAPASAPETPPVGVARGQRTGKPMTAAERAKLEAELAAARTRAADQRREQIRRTD